MAGNNSNVALMLWYGGLVYQRNTGAGDFYVWAKSSQWLACSDPREQVCASSNGFYGINGHYDYPYRPDQVVSYLQALGATTNRVGTINTPEQLTLTVNLAQAFQAANLFVLVNYGLYKDGSLLPDETTAYNYVYEGAAAVAEALKPYGVTTYECGNELTRDTAIILDSTNAGTKGVDFNNVNWPIMRGVMRGMIDGIKSVQPDAQCGINFCVADTGASDLLWDGLQPDGSGRLPEGALGHHDLAQLPHLRRHFQHRHRWRRAWLQPARLRAGPLREAVHDHRVERQRGGGPGLPGELHHGAPRGLLLWT